MARRNMNARQPLKDIARLPPTRKVMRADGVMITEKTCPIPFGRKMVAPDGDVMFLPLANGFTIRGFKGNDYGVQVLEEKLAKGYLPYDECPVAKGLVPVVEGQRPCPGSDGRGKFTDQECCPHITAIAQARKAEHRAGQLEFGRNFATNQDRILDLLEKRALEAAQTPDPKATGKRGVAGG